MNRVDDSTEIHLDQPRSPKREDQQGPAIRAPPRGPPEALLNLSYGVAIRRLIDPSVNTDQLISPLRDMLRAVGLLKA